jgi:hypothetical protein
MKKDFVISRIEASQDGAPYVYIALNDSNDFKPGAEKQQNPFGANMMAFTSPEDPLNVNFLIIFLSPSLLIHFGLHFFNWYP